MGIGGLVVDTEIGIRVAGPHAQGLAGVRPRTYSEARNQTGLTEVGDTIPLVHRRIDAIDIDHPVSVIKRYVNAPEMAFLLKDPGRHGLKLLMGPGANQNLGQIHMDFPRSAAGTRADPA
jgi:hypothetical protein